VPDATTLLKFRRLLEKHRLGEARFGGSWTFVGLFATVMLDLEALMIARDIPGTRVNTMEEAFSHPQLRERGALQYVEHPV